MQLKNVLIVVNDIERSKKFYKDIFGLEVILDNEGNVILTGGLVLQDATIWAEFIENLVIPHNNASELYFEENNIEEFAQKLDESPYDIEYVNHISFRNDLSIVLQTVREIFRKEDTENPELGTWYPFLGNDVEDQQITLKRTKDEMETTR